MRLGTKKEKHTPCFESQMAMHSPILKPLPQVTLDSKACKFLFVCFGDDLELLILPPDCLARQVYTTSPGGCRAGVGHAKWALYQLRYSPGQPWRTTAHLSGSVLGLEWLSVVEPLPSELKAVPTPAIQ